MTDVQKKKAGLAIASLVLGLFFWFPVLGILTSIAALVLGIVAVVKIRNNGEKFGGTGKAVAGIVLGAIGIIMMPFIGLLAAIAIPNFVRAKGMAEQAAVRQAVQTVAQGMEHYQALENRYPTTLEEAVQEGVLPDGILTSRPQYAIDVQILENDFYITAVPASQGSSYASFCMTNDHQMKADTEGGNIDSYDQCKNLPNFR